MRMRVKSLLAVSTVLLLAPTAAFALPAPQCGIGACLEAPCDTVCYIGLKIETTCGDSLGWGCGSGGGDFSESTASVTEAEALQAEESSQVCSEAHPAAELSVTAGS
ncbi:hypothetical protein [Corallococcus carmarthensis]|uniref:Uncharacterized protein n=1 Tax=Corallococcus carmarthensis TaxID=2316728 RepID=A0A3A8KEB3_9BACT|nr:hypothetical protein [Corallococcus carmarthensis]RKH06528.1 hypothetical protein D7X32_04940 [Corallococcus carmarthensis]